MKACDIQIWLVCGLVLVSVHEIQGGSFMESERSKRQSSQVWQQSGLWTDLGVPQFWKDYQNGPFGIVIRGWQFSKCASEQWTDYKVNVTNLVIWPQYPRFPGPIFFNVTMDIKEELPRDRIEMEMEIRHAVVTDTNQKGWQVIPCQGWNILDGCDGIGSCRYCDILDRCRKAVATGQKYASDNPKVLDLLRNPNKLCPPPKGTWTINFSQVFKTEDVPKGIFGPLQSNEYWLTLTFTNGRGTALGCFRLWLDICKYHLYDAQQRCLRDPNALQQFLTQISQEAKALRGDGQ